MCLTGCLDPFEPDVKGGQSLLVVDGHINSQGVTTIRLSRSIDLAQKSAAPVESNATMYIEDEAGTRYLLRETKPGTYASDTLDLPARQRVRLHFTTAKQREYASDYTPVKTTPAIDSVSWRLANGGVQIAVNTHDDTQQSGYYRWDYEETWEFTSAFVSRIELKAGQLTTRFEDIYHCWATENSPAIKLGSTKKLSQDVVSELPLTLLPSNSTKLQRKYSILVKQYALTAEEYGYWELLRKNTENIGTLFDPLPSQLTGNVHCLTDASEIIIGFVGAQTMSERRIFIDTGQLPRNWSFATGYETCVLDTLYRPHENPPPKIKPIPTQFFANVSYTPIEEYYIDGDPYVYYLYSSTDCVDCRKRGTNVKPSFWP
ncbi:DUF4249 domain-containing protein [Hymenobacter sp. DG25B]|uniref:DUF4249 domain-containing protein n=1 Tax=Hymenobacter sp. DG25B TaxID=1385664 RepID=UPI0018CD2196|nr:DUF4249 domain-containing protein [Hymenobacter sp. DG25B]